MSVVLKRPEAERDLDEIWLFIAQDNPDNADRFLDKIEAACWELARFPLMGVNREKLIPGLRSLAVGNYLILYLPLDDGIDLVRVLPGMRDIETIFIEMNR